MLTLSLTLLLAAAPPNPPRLQWTYDGGRIIARYDGKWAEITKTGTVQLTESARAEGFIDLTNPKTEATIRLTTDSYLNKFGNAFELVRPGKWTTTFEPIDLGALSEKYESGGNGPGTVSTGIGDPGGVSYGTYQLASKVGRADEFVKQYYAKEFEGLKGGTPEFTAKWKALAAKDPIALHANEHAFIKETHFDPQVKKLAADLGFDVSKRSRVLQDAVWSTAVQHGPENGLIVDCAQNPADVEENRRVKRARNLESDLRRTRPQEPGRHSRPLPPRQPRLDPRVNKALRKRAEGCSDGTGGERLKPRYFSRTANLAYLNWRFLVMPAGMSSIVPAGSSKPDVVGSATSGAGGTGYWRQRHLDTRAVRQAGRPVKYDCPVHDRAMKCHLSSLSRTPNLRILTISILTHQLDAKICTMSASFTTYVFPSVRFSSRVFASFSDSHAHRTHSPQDLLTSSCRSRQPYPPWNSPLGLYSRSAPKAS